MSQGTRIGLERELELIVARDHPNPHHVLGAHEAQDGVVVRAYRPEASAVRVLPEGAEPVELEPIDPGCLFEGLVGGAALPLVYGLEVDYPDGKTFTLGD